jgi:hypothetical protein
MTTPQPLQAAPASELTQTAESAQPVAQLTVYMASLDEGQTTVPNSQYKSHHVGPANIDALPPGTYQLYLAAQPTAVLVEAKEALKGLTYGMNTDYAPHVTHQMVPLRWIRQARAAIANIERTLGETKESSADAFIPCNDCSNPDGCILLDVCEKKTARTGFMNLPST